MKPEEDKDMHGNKGLYAINPKFNLIILSNMEDEDYDDEIVQMVLDQLPHQEKFKKFYISPLRK